MKKITHFLFLIAVLFLADIAHAQKIYWNDGLAIKRANLDGTNEETLFTVSNTPLYVTATESKIYWTDFNRTIKRANVDGSGMETIVNAQYWVWNGLLFSGSKMYWTEYQCGSGYIKRANLDGSNIEIIADNSDDIDPMGVFISGSKIYWADHCGTKIKRANLDGSNIEILVTNLSPFGYGLGYSGDKMYFTTWGGSTIKRANLNGSNIETVLNASYDIRGFDISGDKMYFRSSNGPIRRANFDGSGVEIIVSNSGGGYNISTGSSPSSSCQDNDGDGYDDISCGGDDCDDDDPNINPGAAEICDGIDNNCNGQIDEGLVEPDVTITESGAPAFCQGLVTLTADVSNLGALQPPVTYLWSNGATTESIEVSAAGNYSVVVTEGNDCTGEDDHDVTSAAWDVLGGYVILGFEVDIDDNTVTGGGVGATGAGEKARLRGGSVVHEFVKAPVISKTGGSTAGHEEIGQVTVTLPAFKASGYNSDDITVPTGGSMTLSGTQYGEIEVKKNATVTFTAAEIHIEDLDVSDGGTVVFTQDAELMIDEDLTLDEDCNFNSAGNFVVVYVGDRTTIDEGSDVTARIYSIDRIYVKPASSGNHTTMTGMFISEDEVNSDEYVDWFADETCGEIGSSNIIVPTNDYKEDNFNTDISLDNSIFTEPSLNIFPNPARDILNIELDNPDDVAEVMIFDSMGRLVWQRSVEEGQSALQLNLDNRFQNGLYVVTAITGNEKIAKRLVISK